MAMKPQTLFPKPQTLNRDILHASCSPRFDFFYLPIDFTTKRNRGYGFINFHSSKDAEEPLAIEVDVSVFWYPRKAVAKVLTGLPPSSSGSLSNQQDFGSGACKDAGL